MKKLFHLIKNYFKIRSLRTEITAIFEGFNITIEIQPDLSKITVILNKSSVYFKFNSQSWHKVLAAHKKLKALNYPTQLILK